MAKKKPLSALETHREEIIREEALKTARATQTPRQTKEQTKLIAKGIAKGIAAYKNQEKIKQRERAKLQNKLRPAENTGLRQNIEAKPAAEPPNPGFDKLPGLTAAGIFMLAGFLHLLRLAFGIEVMIGTFSVPLSWSGAAGVMALILAFWIFRAAQMPIRISRLTNRK
ncbi:MAG: DUF2956 family protein [Methylococcales bacterium]